MSSMCRHYRRRSPRLIHDFIGTVLTAPRFMTKSQISPVWRLPIGSRYKHSDFEKLLLLGKIDWDWGFEP